MKKKKVILTETPILQNRRTITVRFSEVDSLHVVWHGHYLRYFEDGREAFGNQYGLGYMEVHKNGYVTPVVKSVCEHKSPLRYGDEAIVETEYVSSPAAKLIFKFKIYHKQTEKLVATGETVQVFVDQKGELVLTLPEFYQEWKRKWKQL